MYNGDLPIKDADTQVQSTVVATPQQNHSDYTEAEKAYPVWQALNKGESLTALQLLTEDEVRASIAEHTIRCEEHGLIDPILLLSCKQQIPAIIESLLSIPPVLHNALLLCKRAIASRNPEVRSLFGYLLSFPTISTNAHVNGNRLLMSVSIEHNFEAMQTLLSLPNVCSTPSRHWQSVLRSALLQSNSELMRQILELPIIHNDHQLLTDLITDEAYLGSGLRHNGQFNPLFTELLNTAIAWDLDDMDCGRIIDALNFAKLEQQALQFLALPKIVASSNITLLTKLCSALPRACMGSMNNIAMAIITLPNFKTHIAHYYDGALNALSTAVLYNMLDVANELISSDLPTFMNINTINTIISHNAKGIFDELLKSNHVRNLLDVPDNGHRMTPLEFATRFPEIFLSLLELPNVRATAHKRNNSVLISALRDKSLTAVQALLAIDTVSNSIDPNLLLSRICETYNASKIIAFVLEKVPQLIQSDEEFIAILNAILPNQTQAINTYHEHVEQSVLKLLTVDAIKTQVCINNTILNKSILNNLPNVVRELLMIPIVMNRLYFDRTVDSLSIDDGTNTRKLIDWAIQNQYNDIVNNMLNSYCVFSKITDEDYYNFFNRAVIYNPSMALDLLKTPGMQTKLLSNALTILVHVCHNNAIHVFDVIYQNSQIYNVAHLERNSCLKEAIRHPDLEIATQLIKNKYIIANVTSELSLLFIDATHAHNHNLCALLLELPYVADNAHCDNNLALRVAYESHHVDNFNRLLSLPKVQEQLENDWLSNTPLFAGTNAPFMDYGTMPLLISVLKLFSSGAARCLLLQLNNVKNHLSEFIVPTFIRLLQIPQIKDYIAKNTEWFVNTIQNPKLIVAAMQEPELQPLIAKHLPDTQVARVTAINNHIHVYLKNIIANDNRIPLPGTAMEHIADFLGQKTGYTKSILGLNNASNTIPNSVWLQRLGGRHRSKQDQDCRTSLPLFALAYQARRNNTYATQHATNSSALAEIPSSHDGKQRKKGN